MIGSAIGSSFEKGPTVEGPRLSDLKTQTSDYGTFIPIIYGRARVGGNVFWATEIKETRHKEEMGKGGPQQTNITYTYSASFAVALCDNEIEGVRRIWMNGELVFTASNLASAGSIRVSGEKKDSVNAGSFTVYKGTEDQPTDPTMAAEDGLELTPGYLGLAYVVFKDLQLEKFGNRIPQVEFEVVSKNAGDVEGPRAVSAQTTVDISEAVGDDTTLLPAVVGSTEVNPAFPGDYGDAGEKACAPSGSDAGVFTYQQIRSQDSMGGTVDPPGVFVSNKKDKVASLVFDDDGALLSKTNRRATLSPRCNDEGATGGRYPLGRLGGQFVSALTPIDYYLQGYLGLAGPVSEVQIVVGGKYYQIDGVDYYMEGSANACDQLDQSRFLAGAVCSSDESSLYIFTSPTQVNAGGVRTIDMYHRFEWIGDELILAQEVVLDEPLPWGAAFPGSAQPLWFMAFGHFDFTSRGIGMVEAGGQCLWTTVASGAPGTDRRLSLWQFDSAGQLSLTKVFDESLPIEISKALWVSGGYCRLGAPYQYNTPYSISAYTYQGWRYKFGDYTRTETITPTGLSLATIVEDQLARVGYDPSEYDVSELESDVVEGYVVNTLTSALGNIEPLQKCYFFDMVESGGVLRFVKRGQAAVANLTTDDMAASENFAESPTALETSRIQDIDLPREVLLSYLDINADYRYGTQYERRQITKSVSKIGLQLTVMMDADKAKHVCGTMLYNSWSERERFKWSTTMKWAQLEPTDVVNLERDGITWTVRIQKRNEGANGIIQFEGVQDLPSVYDQRSTGVQPPGTTGDDIDLIPPTYGLAFNAPPLLNSIDAMGWYVAGAPMTDGSWPGAVFYRSVDDGGSYSLVSASFLDRGQSSAVGYTLTALDPWTNGDVWDDLSRVRVLVQGGETLQSRTEAEVYNGANTAWLGGELVQFCEATQVSSRIYELRRFLRGRQGTEHAATTHEAGEGFAVVNTTDTVFVPDELGSIGQASVLKAVTIGGDSAGGLAQDFTPDGSTLKPFAPVHCVAQATAGGILMTWVRRARINNGWQNNIDVPLDEPSERYEIDVFSDDTFSTVLRTISVAGASSVLYTDDEQTADFGAPQTQVHARVYQLSSRVGRGWPATFEIA